jgi:maltose alpha-D-glucosyltransferase/alpha-amylase
MPPAPHEADATLTRLEGRMAGLPTATLAAAQQLLAQRNDVLRAIEAKLPGQGRSLKIRHHGDYHLGQVLLSLNDFVIIDFEGEPGRSIDERRRKHSPLRDVAGMLRSFDYAARTAREHAGEGSDKGQAMFDAVTEAWRRETERAFLDSYANTVADSGLYGDWPAARHLLRLFVLEKACYELRYELDHRPEWVHVPIHGILAIVDEI